ncbi:MAG: hypothetical protein Q9160_002264 [Pyrenula sp. 1 TL-2023]
MAGPETPSGGGKAMSSRLLTMKFMQRAAAAASSASNKSPHSSNSTTYATPNSDVHTTKRRRLSPSLNSSPASIPVTPITPMPTDFSASVSAAVAAEEAARVEALARDCGVTAETKWILNYPGLPNAVDNGTSDQNAPEIDGSSNSSHEETPMSGRRTYGNFRRRKRFGEGRVEELHAGDGASDEDDERQKQTKVEGVYASKAQRKLRDGTDPDKANLRGLGKVSGFHNDKGREGKLVSPKKGGKRQNSVKDERRKKRASEDRLCLEKHRR